MEKAVTDAPKPPSKVFDVSKPGKTMAAATGRPVIVSNRPIMQDPMVSAQVTAESDTSGRGSSKVVIKPLSGEEEGQTADSEVRAVASEPSKDLEEKSDDSEKSEETAEAAKAEPKVPEKPDAESDTTDDTAQDGTPALDGANTSTSKEAAELEATAKQLEEIDKLTESKDYFLPINSVEKRRSKIVTILGLVLIIVLGLLLINLLLDVGVISIDGVRPVTHFFSS
ncbi:MAG: hypothetical protein JWP13_339 [Candidatus Saccharibacteria bacterium]|nr:hypothetical protein [Candidatus Saccharibacteria bacterium]